VDSIIVRADAVGSLLVGGYDDAGDLVYCGHISSDLSDRMRRTLYVQLSEIHSPA
jgi:ATP-dependent DNA ligase